MTTTPEILKPKVSFAVLCCEIGTLVFVIGSWAFGKGLLASGSWQPVLLMAIAGTLFGVVKFCFLVRERDNTPRTGVAWFAHLVKTAVLAGACAVLSLVVFA